MFKLQETPLNINALHASKIDPAFGAMVSIEGMVRADRHDGKLVSGLHYYADADACTREGESIIKEAHTLFPTAHTVCVQRIGIVHAGEAAIWIGAWSPHRD